MDDSRSRLYRVLRDRGHATLASLRCAYAWHGASVTTTAAEHADLARIQADMHTEDFERALIRASLCVLPCDQTFAICLCDGDPDVDPSWQLFAAWRKPYSSLTIDQALDFAAAVLYEQRWCPAHGAAEGAQDFHNAERQAQRAAFELEADDGFAKLMQSHTATMELVREATRLVLHDQNAHDVDLKLTGRNWIIPL